MAFVPGHSCVVLYAVETGSITESSDGTTPAALPAIPSSAGVLGYSDLPDFARGLNNDKGFAIGMQGAAYNKRGAVQPSISVNIRPGNTTAIAKVFPPNASGAMTEPATLPSLCLFFVQAGQPVVVFRFCKPGSAAIQFSGGDGQGGEVTIAVPFQAIAVQSASAMTVTAASVRALGTPLFWHDVHTFSIADSTATVNDYRRALMSLSIQVDYGLERKNERPNWGDNAPLSRTSYALLEHHTKISGEIGLHERMTNAYFDAAVSSQDWGNIVINCSNSVLALSDTKGFTITLGGVMPADEHMTGGDSSSEVNYTVPIKANTLVFALDS